MEKILLFLFLISSCTVNKETELEKKRSQYPFWDLVFGGFLVESPVGINPPIHQLRLIPAEKRAMLQVLDTIRFIINTPEFAEKVMAGRFISAHDMKGPNGDVKVGDVYDNERLLYVIRQSMLGLVIKKMSLDYPKIAIGAVGPPLYVLENTSESTRRIYWIALNNRLRWDQVHDFKDPAFVARVVFHETLHNAGFYHLPGAVNTATDMVYQMQEILYQTYCDPHWQGKYLEALKDFKPFYEKKEKKWLTQDTKIGAASDISSAIPENTTVTAVSYSVDSYGNCVECE